MSAGRWQQTSRRQNANANPTMASRSKEYDVAEYTGAVAHWRQTTKPSPTALAGGRDVFKGMSDCKPWLLNVTLASVHPIAAACSRCASTASLRSLEYPMHKLGMRSKAQKSRMN